MKDGAAILEIMAVKNFVLLTMFLGLVIQYYVLRSLVSSIVLARARAWFDLLSFAEAC